MYVHIRLYMGVYVFVFHDYADDFMYPFMCVRACTDV